MIEFFERSVVRLLRIPPAPDAVSRPVEGTQAFRASRNYYRFRLVGWSLSQVSAAIGILMFLWFTVLFDFEIPPVLVDELAKHGVTWLRGVAQERVLGMSIRNGFFGFEIVGIALFLVQLPITFAMLRLEYRMRWYVLSDRSLQIRAGVRNVREQTLSLANIQNVLLEQGPLERLFGFASVKVRTAGGGSGADSREGNPDKAEEKALHVGWLRGLDNAEAVRDRILDAVRRHRHPGLGERPGPVPSRIVREGEDAADRAARELLEEIRSWRRAIGT